MSDTSLGTSLDLVSTTQLENLGFTVEEFDPAGGGLKVYTYTKNSGASAWEVGTVVSGNPAATPVADAVIAPVNTASARVKGVSFQAVPVGSFAFVQTKGKCQVLIAGTCNSGIALAVSATAGKAKAVAATVDDAFGYSIDDANITDALADAWINCGG